MTNKIGNKTLGTPKTYLELITAFPPRKITSEEELATTQNIIDSLLDQETLTPDERDYLHLLGLVVAEYEEKNYPVPNIYGVNLLKVLLEELNLQPQDLIPINGIICRYSRSILQTVHSLTKYGTPLQTSPRSRGEALNLLFSIIKKSNF
ncbi:helix-turn-helix domain-containing protein [Anabaena azotica]|uniref:helix-turn-helix domain-containing protein n=1 Tax=Anabaena azotica TaxID=197653 RepID=UPI0039A5F03C